MWLLQTLRVGFRALHKEAERRTGPKMVDSTILKITPVIAFVKTVRSTSAMVLAPYRLTVNTYISMVGRVSTHGFRLRESGRNVTCRRQSLNTPGCMATWMFHGGARFAG